MKFLNNKKGQSMTMLATPLITGIILAVILNFYSFTLVVNIGGALILGSLLLLLFPMTRKAGIMVSILTFAYWLTQWVFMAIGGQI